MIYRNVKRSISLSQNSMIKTVPVSQEQRGPKSILITDKMKAKVKRIWRLFSPLRLCPFKSKENRIFCFDEDNAFIVNINVSRVKWWEGCWQGDKIGRFFHHLGTVWSFGYKFSVKFGHFIYVFSFVGGSASMIRLAKTLKKVKSQGWLPFWALLRKWGAFSSISSGHPGTWQSWSLGVARWSRGLSDCFRGRILSRPPRVRFQVPTEKKNISDLIVPWKYQ